MKKRFEFIILFFSILTFVVVVDSCKVVLSEINSDNPGKDKKEFIELEFSCKNNEIATTSNLVIFILKGLSRNHKPSISFYAKLNEFTKDNRNFYVIGNDEVQPLPDLLFSHSNVCSSQKIIQKKRTLFDMLPNESPFPEAILLLNVNVCITKIRKRRHCIYRSQKPFYRVRRVFNIDSTIFDRHGCI